MLPLRTLSVNIGTERRRIDISHIGSTVESAAEITRSVFHHRSVGGCVFAGLVCRRFAASKSKKFIRVAEILNIADFGKDGCTEQMKKNVQKASETVFEWLDFLEQAKACAGH